MARKKARTFWHPIAYTLIDATLPEGYQSIPEYLLHYEPQQADLVVLLREDRNPGEIDQLPCLMERLGAVTLLEYKGVTDDLEARDPSVLLGYACQLAVERGLEPAQVQLGVIAVRVTSGFQARIAAHGGCLSAVDVGIWEGNIGGFPLFLIETSSVWQRSEQDRLLYVLTPEFLKEPRRIHPMTEEQEILYNQLYRRLKREKPEGTMALKNYDELKRSFDETLREFIEGLPLEERLKGLKAEERLKGLKAEERLEGLKAEERLKGLQAEEILQAMSPEELERLKTLLH